MLGSVRFVARDSLAAKTSKDSESEKNNVRPDVDDPEMLAKRKGAGLEWMSAAPSRAPAQKQTEFEPQVVASEPRANSKELNPFFKDGGEGYPSDDNEGSGQRKVPGGVGDGGASWLLKGLKRAQEQAAREGKKLPDVIEDRWGSLDTFSGVTGRRAAHANAHLHAIRDRKRRYENTTAAGDTKDNSEDPKERDREGSRSRMKAPRLDGSLKWKGQSRETGRQMRPEDSAVLKAAASSYNVFENDGSFLQKFKEMEAKTDKNNKQGRGDSKDNPDRIERKRNDEMKDRSPVENQAVTPNPENVNANQLAAKAMKLKLMGKVKEADELLKQAESLRNSSGSAGPSKDTRRSGDEAVLKNVTARQRHGDQNKDSDMVLASKIYRNRERYNADEEYDDVGIESERQKKKSERKGVTRARNTAVSQYNRIQIQHERCQFCFENPSRPKHLTIAIGNFTYLMLPPTAPLVPGHCYILPTQHEGSTRNVDDDVWEELRNFKKCLLKMFKEQEKDVIFMETVMGLSQQRRHCLIECVPVPSNVVKQAPLYFKKAIDEAEDEWSQHNAKKLIDTRGKGLRASIPKNFPYFHVEFGLEGGYCHVIDDETSFKSSFGRDVLIGLLKLPQERMHQKSKHESHQQQMAAVKEFSQQWKPHDWTAMLE